MAIDTRPSVDDYLVAMKNNLPDITHVTPGLAEKVKQDALAAKNSKAAEVITGQTQEAADQDIADILTQMRGEM